ncbi:alpha/beta hydrolase [Streptomyces calidiresistens]|uniref:Alpha/beta fold hydrolase n=1 Tax=Streptomyces calidiresistens TaxID=1485586 RepID=A0A7W3T538_9ACTN|nr:alpha/beta hydrolase [Streptomyces calidiresistens]MBB0230938.1 alpha/beta fold hydrolase [Streptomyces calidiresistens]
MSPRPDSDTRTRAAVPGGPAGAVPAARAGTRSRELVVESTGGARLHTVVREPARPADPDAPAAPAPTIVLAHGWTCAISFWDAVLDRLPPDHRVVRYDQRGHGRTPAVRRGCAPDRLADDLCAVLAATVPDGERAVVGGHSMGAMSIVAAADRPTFRERVGAAMLCSTGTDRLIPEARVTPFRSVALRTRAQRLLLGSTLPMGPVTPLTEWALARTTLGPGADRRLRREVAELVHACPRRSRAEWAAVLAALDLREKLPLLTVPTVVVHGTADALTPPVHAHRIARALPNAGEPVMLPDLGHMTPMEDPGRVAGILRDLAREHPPAGASGRSPRPEESVEGAGSGAGAGAGAGEEA